MAVNILILGGGGTATTKALITDLCLECGDRVHIITGDTAETIDTLEYDRVYHNERILHSHVDIDFKPEPVKKQESWQSMNRGVKSKKQRRQL